jgi:hypothetical protein
VLLPGTGEHLARIRTHVFKYHVYTRKSLASWMGGIRRESLASKKTAKTALGHAPKADIERSLFPIDELYTKVSARSSWCD